MSFTDDHQTDPTTLDASTARRRVPIRTRVLQACAFLLTAGALVGVSLPAHADMVSADDVVTASPGRITSVRFDKDLLMPTTGRVTSPFGMRTHPITGDYRLHTGTDFAAPAGTPVLAAADGTVTSAGEAGAYGNRIVVHHGDVDGRRLETTYSHLSAFEVTVGQEVSVGDLIGRVGTTGLSTGNHLHFEVRLDGLYADPMDSLLTAGELAAKAAPEEPEPPAEEEASEKPAEDTPQESADDAPAQPAEEPAKPAQEAAEAARPAEDAEDAAPENRAKPTGDAPAKPAEDAPRGQHALIRLKPIEAVWAERPEAPAAPDVPWTPPTGSWWRLEQIPGMDLLR